IIHGSRCRLTPQANQGLGVNCPCALVSVQSHLHPRAETNRLGSTSLFLLAVGCNEPLSQWVDLARRVRRTLQTARRGSWPLSEDLHSIRRGARTLFEPPGPRGRDPDPRRDDPAGNSGGNPLRTGSLLRICPRLGADCSGPGWDWTRLACAGLRILVPSDGQAQLLRRPDAHLGLRDSFNPNDRASLGISLHRCLFRAWRSKDQRKSNRTVASPDPDPRGGEDLPHLWPVEPAIEPLLPDLRLPAWLMVRPPLQSE